MSFWFITTSQVLAARQENYSVPQNLFEIHLRAAADANKSVDVERLNWFRGYSNVGIM